MGAGSEGATMKSLLLNPEVRSIWGKGGEAELLEAYERVWDRKVLLRAIYEQWYRRIAEVLRPGPIVEIGAGTGNFRRWLGRRDCWALDILPGRHVAVRADALHLPFADRSLANLVLIDTLHHLARPFDFLHQAARALRPGGRVILVEPYVSVWGWFVWKFLHHERVDFRRIEAIEEKAAWEGNAAIPRWVLSRRNRDRLPLKITAMEYGECLTYPLSGGFSYRSLLPGPVLLRLRHLEQSPLFRNPWVSLRVFAVLETVGAPEPGVPPEAGTSIRSTS
jgi:SAM-dependent methyltransferase